MSKRSKMPPARQIPTMPGGVPLIGQHQTQHQQSPLDPRMPQQVHQHMSPQEQMKAQISQDIRQLSLEIYTSVIAAKYDDGVDPDCLKEIALDARTAAQIFFESMGVRFEDPEDANKETGTKDQDAKTVE